MPDMDGKRVENHEHRSRSDRTDMVDPDRGLRLLARMIARHLIQQGSPRTQPLREQKAESLPPTKDKV